LSRKGDARWRAVAAVLAIAFSIGVAGMVGQGLFFLTTAYGVQQSRELAVWTQVPARSGEPARVAGDVQTGAKLGRATPGVLNQSVVWRPRLAPDQALASVMSAGFPYRRTVLRAADRYAVDPGLVFAIMASESRGDPEAVSPSGAIGLMQLMPTTAVELGVDPWKPEENIDGAVRYLSTLLEQFKSVDLSLVAYNAGPGFAERYRQGQVDLGAETRAFIMRVAGLL
jgi:soluble lytic murein transglycosylase-like protein